MCLIVEHRAIPTRPLGEPEIALGHEPRIEASFACRSHSLDDVATNQQRKLMRMNQAQLLQRGKVTVGWISRKKSRLRSWRSFFLDIPFYRTH